MRRLFATIVFSLCLLSMMAQQQQPVSWQQLWQEMMTPEDDDEEEMMSEETFELLQELADHPIDLNRATQNELEQLPFLSAQQVMDLVEYRDRYGAIRSMNEMRTIRSLDYQQLALMPCFTYIGEVNDTLRFPSMKNIAKWGRHDLSASMRVPFYERKGDRNGYLGYRYRHWLRYEFHYGDYVRFGLVGAQDAGEPFFSNRNSWGYDVYSYYFQMRKLGKLDNLVVGNYRMSTGMGLVLNNNILMGKLATLQRLGRTPTAFRPNASSVSAKRFQGIAATLSLSRKLKMTAFASYRPLDATLNKDGTAATLLTTSYHRTPKEMEKKNNTHETAAGADLAFSHRGLRLGATAVYSHLDRRLSPDTRQNYRRYYPAGDNFLNASLNYGYTHYRFAFSGETALDKDGHLATIHALSYQPSATWSLVAVQRFYGYRYQSLYGNAFGEGSRVQNESGCFIGGTWQPFRRLQLQGYADFVYFPWARYRVSQSSSAQDYLAEATYSLSRSWTLKGRYRVHLRRLDNKKKTALRPHNEHRARLSLTYSDSEWTNTLEGDFVRAVNDSIDHGWMVSENVAWHHAWWQLGLTAAYFHTDSYDSRIYAKERQLPHNYAFPMYYGRGFRLSLVARAFIGRHLQLDAKIGHTNYRDRTSIGTGLQQIDASHMTDLDVQARWRF